MTRLSSSRGGAHPPPTRPMPPWGWFVIAGLSGGLLVLAAGPFMRAGLVGPPADAWTSAAIVSTLAGLLAALLGIAVVVVLAVQWLLLERRVDARVAERLTATEAELQTYVRKRVQAMGELLMAWGRSVDALDRAARRTISLAPDTPNVAPLVALSYVRHVQFLLDEWHAPGTRLVPKEPPDAEVRRCLEAATEWAQSALAHPEYHDAGLPDLAMAEVCAYGKQPRRARDHLRSALSAGVASPAEVASDSVLWQAFVGSSAGESELPILDDILQLLGTPRPTVAAATEHCHNVDNWQQSRFLAVLKATGDVREVVVTSAPCEGVEHMWKTMGVLEGVDAAADFDTFIGSLWDHVIPVRLIPGDRRIWTATATATRRRGD